MTTPEPVHVPVEEYRALIEVALWAQSVLAPARDARERTFRREKLAEKVAVLLALRPDMKSGDAA